MDENASCGALRRRSPLAHPRARLQIDCATAGCEGRIPYKRWRAYHLHCNACEEKNRKPRPPHPPPPCSFLPTVAAPAALPVAATTHPTPVAPALALTTAAGSGQPCGTLLLTTVAHWTRSLPALTTRAHMFAASFAPGAAAAAAASAALVDAAPTPAQSISSTPLSLVFCYADERRWDNFPVRLRDVSELLLAAPFQLMRDNPSLAVLRYPPLCTKGQSRHRILHAHLARMR